MDAAKTAAQASVVSPDTPIDDRTRDIGLQIAGTCVGCNDRRFGPSWSGAHPLPGAVRGRNRTATPLSPFRRRRHLRPRPTLA